MRYDLSFALKGFFNKEDSPAHNRTTISNYRNIIMQSLLLFYAKDSWNENTLPRHFPPSLKKPMVLGDK